MKILLVQDLERPHHSILEEHIVSIKAIDPTIELVLCSTTELDEINRHYGRRGYSCGDDCIPT